MDAKSTLEKVYDLKILGGADVYNELVKINEMFEKIKQNKTKIKVDISTAESQEQVKELTEKLVKLEKEYQALTKTFNELKIKVAEAKNVQEEQIRLSKIAAQEAARANNEAKKETELKKQASEEKKAQFYEEKRQLAEISKLQKQAAVDAANAKAAAKAAAVTAAPGSYNDISKQYRELSQRYKNTVDISDSAAVKAATDDLMKLKEQLDNFSRSLTKDKTLVGEYTTGVVQAFHKMGLGNIVTEQVQKAKSALDTLNQEFVVLVDEMKQIKASGNGSLDAVNKMLLENRQAAAQLDEQINAVNKSLAEVGNVGQQISETIREEFKSMKQSVAEFILGYVGFQGIMDGINNSIESNYTLSDSFADLKIRIKGTDEEVEQLVESLKKLDTRTSLKSLVDIAAVVAKKGVAKEEIAGITQAIDNLMISLGTEIGDPHEAVSSLVKLVNVYSEDKHVTANNINAIGGAIQKLTTSGVATGQFLIDFAERMGGVRGITGITIDKVLGLGAALEELGQHSEVGASAMSQLMVKMFTDTQRYADITGKSLFEFTQLLQKDAISALVLVAEKLKGNAGEMEHFFEGVEEMHTKGVRMVGVLGDITSNAEYARKRMADAAGAMYEIGRVADAAGAKQNNFAATIDRIKKAFELMAANKTVAATLSGIASMLLLVLNNMGGIITTLTTLGVLWAVFNARMIAAKIAIAYTNLEFKAQYYWLVLNETWNKAYTASLVMMTGAQGTAAVSARALWLAMAANPFTAIVAILGLAVAAFALLDSEISNTTEDFKKLANQRFLDYQIQAKANAAISEQISKLNTYNKLLTSSITSIDTKKKALAELVKEYPAYKDVLVDETGKVLGLKQAYDSVAGSIKAAAEAKASAALSAEKQGEVLTVTTLRQRIETEAALQTNDKQKGFSQVKIDNLSDTEKDIIKKVVDAVNKDAAKGGGKLSSMGSNGITFPAGITGTISEALKQEEDRRAKIAEEYANAAAKRLGVSLSSVPGTDDVNTPGGDEDPTIQEIQKMIKKKKYAITKAKAGSDELKKLNKELKDLQEKLAYELGKLKGHGSKLSVEETEGAKLINANRDKEIANLKIAYMSEEAAKKIYNHRMIDNERAFQEELQKIEEEAIKKKAQLIKGKLPAEQAARAGYVLQLLESVKKYSDTYFKMDAEKLNSDREEMALESKDKLDKVERNKESDDMQIAIAKVEYYTELEEGYKKYMAHMDKLEQKFNQNSEKNVKARDRILRSIQDNKGKSEAEINEAHVKRSDDSLDQLYKADALKIVEEKIKKTKAIIGNLKLGPEAKKKLMEEAGEEFDKKMLSADEENVQRQLDNAKRLFDEKYITEKQYQDRVIGLRDKEQQDLEKRLALEDKMKREKEERERAAIEGAFSVAQTVASEYLAMDARRDAAQDKQRQKEMDLNKKKLDSQAQSLQQQRANEQAYYLQQQELEKKRLADEKSRARTAMAIEYALSALKIVANNIYKGPSGWAQIAIEEGVLAATYAAKIALMGQYEQGGDVPAGGGEFGGNSHSAGGTPFMFRGRAFEAEAKELAIINKRSAGSSQLFTVTGTPKQIASGINAIGGGRNFAPGAMMRPYAYPGTMGMNLPMPVISQSLSRGYGGGSGGVDNSAEFARIYAMVSNLTQHVQTIQVTLNPNAVTEQQGRYEKAVRVGRL